MLKTILTCDEEKQSKTSRMKRVEEKIGAEGGKEEEEEAESPLRSEWKILSSEFEKSIRKG